MRLVTYPMWFMLNNHMVDYPTPSNMNYFWGFGSIAGLCMLLQMVSGMLISMHYTSFDSLSFLSVEHLTRNVNNGWLISYTHTNGASFLFIVMYVHMASGLYFQSYSKKMLWHLGVIMFFMLMATSFLGYVLPWGQMSLWAATVMTNLFSVMPLCGDIMTQWLWGGYSVANPTLKSFFSLHFFLPFFSMGLILTHLSILHISGSTNPLHMSSAVDHISFYPYYYFKDLYIAIMLIFCLCVFVFFMPNFLNHTDNYIKANSLVTPPHIVPEWYFLPFYAMLSSVPNKLCGVVAMLASIFILFLLPHGSHNMKSSNRYNLFMLFLYWIFIVDFFLLMWLGTKPPESKYILLTVIATSLYFMYFMVLLL